MTEAWRDIPGLDGYQASKAGRVRSLTRKVSCKNGCRISKGRVLVPWIVTSTGYAQVNASSQRYSVHRLVALAWVSGHFDGAQVNHMNSVRDDNRAVNLEWVTASENVAHGYRAGRTPNCLGKFSHLHPTSKAVVSTCLETGDVTQYGAANDAVQDGFDSGCISRCCHGKSKSHKGRSWQFAGDRHGVVWTDPQGDMIHER